MDNSNLPQNNRVQIKAEFQKPEPSESGFSMFEYSQINLQNKIAVAVDNPDFLPVLQKSANKLINFIYLNHKVNMLRSDLVAALEAKGKGSIILDFGEQPDVNTFMDHVYDEALKSMTTSFNHQILQARLLGIQLQKLISDLSTNPINEEILQRIFKLSKELSELFTFVMANNEILQIIFEKYCDIFERKSWDGLLKVSASREGKFIRLLYHSALMNFHYLLKQIIKKQNLEAVPLRKPLNDPQEIRTGTEADYLNQNNLVEDTPDLALTKGILDQIHQQNALIIHHQAWLLEHMGISPMEYDNVVYYEQQSLSLMTSVYSADEFFEIASTRPQVNETENLKIIKYATHNYMDLGIIYFHTFLYIMNLYGLAMTSFLYAKALGLDTSISGLIQAGTPLGSTVLGFFINWVTKFKKWYWVHLSVQLLMIIGNVLYFVAAKYEYTDKSMGIIVLVIARVLIGMGGARLLTRKYIVMNVQGWAQSKYSAIFVGVTATGICLGPGISSLLLFYNGGNSIGDIPLEQYNLFSWVFIYLWIITLIFSAIFFVGKNPIEEIETKLKIQNKTKIIRFFKDIKHENYKYLFDLNENNLKEFPSSSMQNGTVPVNNNLNLQNPKTGIETSKFTDFTNKESLQNERIIITEDLMENKQTSNHQKNNKEQVYNNAKNQGELNVNFPKNYSQLENNEIYGNNALIYTENLTSSVKVVHPFKWTLFAVFSLFVVKVI